MVTLTIDGIEVSVERGASILDAAQKAGVRIPTLCNDKRLIPFGACRLCIVEVTARGRTRTMPSCFNPARDGMQVATHTPKLIESRQMQLSLLLRSHPLSCPSCDAAGNCQLQNLVHEYEIPDLPFDRETRYYHVDNDSPFIRFNMNLCIKCGMCVRICDEVQGQRELSFVNRGMLSEISTDFGRPLDCEFCGQCASICPVGAIASKWLVGTGREFELKKTVTTCSFCSLGCTLSLGQKGDKVVWVSSPPDSPNEGSLCVKGRYGWPYAYSSKRLTKPLIRKNGTLQEVDWNEAFKFVADGLNAIKKEAGPESLAALGSERLTNEEAYVFNRFVRTVMETPHLDHSGGYGYRALVEGLAPALGYPASTNSIREIRKANVILLLGADLTETHPLAKNEIIIATGRDRAKAIVIDSLRTKLTERQGLFLPVPPGSKHLVVSAMLKCIIDEGLFDKTALDLRADGFDILAASLENYAPERMSQLLGIGADLIKQAAREYAGAPKAVIVMTAGMYKTENSVETARAAANLALVTGHIGKEACGIFILGEKANAQGTIDMGLTPDLLPGFENIENATARSKYEAAWDSPIPDKRGFGAREIFQKAGIGEIKGLYVVAENPMDTYPDRIFIEKALTNLQFVVVQDIFLSATAQMAHAVLPAVSFAERSGTYTSADRRVQLLRPCLRSASGKSDLEIFTALAAVMGKPSMTYSGPDQVMREISRLVGVYGGISYDRLGEYGLAWPCEDSEDPGKEILYEGGFPIGKAQLEGASKMEELSKNGLPMYLIPVPVKFHSGSLSEWSQSLMEVCPVGYAEMNVKDLKAMGIKNDDTVKITAADGASIQVPVRISRRALEGSVIVPYHFSALAINRFTRWGEPAVKIQIQKV